MRNILRALGIILFIIIFLGGPSRSQANQGTAKTSTLLERYVASKPYCDKAENLIRHKKFKEARIELGKCLAVSEKQERARYLLAQICYDEHEFLEAANEMERAESDFKDIQDLLSWKDRDVIKQIEAKKEFITETIQELTEEAQVAMCRRDLLLLQIKNMEQEISTLNSEELGLVTQNVRIPADYYFLHGNCFFKIQKYPEAEAQYTKALETDRKHVNSYNNLINLYYITGRMDKASGVLKMAEENHVVINAGLKKAVEKKLNS